MSDKDLLLEWKRATALLLLCRELNHAVCAGDRSTTTAIRLQLVGVEDVLITPQPGHTLDVSVMCPRPCSTPLLINNFGLQSLPSFSAGMYSVMTLLFESPESYGGNYCMTIRHSKTVIDIPFIVRQSPTVSRAA